MLIDQSLVLSDAQAITATAASTNVYDSTQGTLVSGSTGIGAGEPVYVIVNVGTAFATLTSLTFSLRTSDTVSSGALSSATTLISTPAIGVASLTANSAQAAFVIPPLGGKRYFDVNYTVGGSNATAGTVTAYISPKAPAHNIPTYSIATIA